MQEDVRPITYNYQNHPKHDFFSNYFPFYKTVKFYTE